ncbi:MAG TPA: PEGA domain-containing protein, partial [Aquabacterium sp.]|nr:PEGA domain-containing protein [Aquabacterium sp.]
ASAPVTSAKSSTHLEAASAVVPMAVAPVASAASAMANESVVTGAASAASAVAVPAAVSPEASQAPAASAVEPASSQVDAPAMARPAEVSEAPTGKVTLAVSPWGEVTVDGRHMGVTPPLTQLNLTPGKHVIAIRNGDAPPYRKTVTVKSGRTYAVEHQF